MRIRDAFHLPFDDIHLKSLRPISFSESEFLAHRLFKYYRKKGYPHVVCDDAELIKQFDQLRKTPSCLVDGVLKQSMIGLTIVNSYHPEMISVRCRNFRTAEEVFDDDDLFMKAIHKRIQYGDNVRSWGIRKSIASLSRAQKVSNFRPTVAKSILSHFKPRLVVDWSAGWGGRVLGAMANGTQYIGIDPNLHAVLHNRRMCKRVKSLTGCTSRTTIVCGCAEELLGNGFFSPDLIFTSPPYFDVEKYDSEPTQSFLRYPEEDLWWKKFFRRCCLGSYKDLHPKGNLVLNVSSEMRDRAVDLAEDVGFKLRDEWNMLLSNHQFNKASSCYRSEPVLIFKKAK